MIPITVALAIAAIMFLIGMWGRRNANVLVSTTLSTRDQEKKVRQYRRGANWIIAGAIILVARTAWNASAWWSR